MRLHESGRSRGYCCLSTPVYLTGLCKLANTLELKIAHSGLEIESTYNEKAAYNKGRVTGVFTMKPVQAKTASHHQRCLRILKKRQIRQEEEEAHSSEDPHDSCVMLCCDQLIHQTIGSDRRPEYTLGKLIVSDRDDLSGNSVGLG